MTPEYEQYCIGQAEAWLEKVRKSAAYARQLEESAAAQYALADGLKAMDYSRIRVAVSATPDAIPNAVANHVEMGDKFKQISDDAKRRMTEAAVAIAQLDDPTESTCLHLYYVDALETWEHVCVKMHYSYDGMMKLRRRAVLHAYEVMPHAEREPRAPAI